MVLLVVCEGHLRYGGPDYSLAMHQSVGQNGLVKLWEWAMLELVATEVANRSFTVS